MKVDWLEGTVKGKRTADILEYLRQWLGEFQELPHGNYGYARSAIAVGSGRVYWHDQRVDMGVHVSLPSTAISNLGLNPVSLLCEFLGYGVDFTRIDLACDDTKGILNLDEIERAVRCTDYVSRWHKVKRIEDIVDGKSSGRTYYFGSSSSDATIRIYDKAAERRAAGENFVGDWIRVEIEAHNKRAHKIAEHIATHQGDWQAWAAGLIKGYLDFKIPSADSNKSRWLTASWWDELLGFTSKERLTFSVGVRTIEDIESWFDRQLAPSLCALQVVKSKDGLSEMISKASYRLKEQHIAMINLALSYHEGARESKRST